MEKEKIIGKEESTELKTGSQVMLEVKIKIQKIADLYENLEIELNKTNSYEVFFETMDIYGEEILKEREGLNLLFPVEFKIN